MADTLYPGTTPFERLSAGGGGAAGAGSAERVSSKALTAQINQAKRTADMKQQEIGNQKTIADNNNKTAIEVANINANAGSKGFFNDAREGSGSMAEYINESRKATDARRAEEKQRKRWEKAQKESGVTIPPMRIHVRKKAGITGSSK